MKKISLLAAILGVVILLPGCSVFRSSSVTEEERALPENTTEFSGQNFEVDESQSLISFEGKKGGVFQHEGKFENFFVEITPNDGDPSNFENAQITANIDITSMVTDNDGLTKHLLSDDFFATETYPEATFQSISIEHLGGNQYAITGDLTMRGNTNEVTMEAELTDAFLYAEYDLNRVDFGIGKSGEVDDIVPMTFKMIFMNQ